MATKYFALQPINHRGKHYRPGDEITGFTGWWRYWQYLRYRRVNQVDTAGGPTITAITPGNTILTLAVTIPSDMGDGFNNYEYKLDAGAWVAFDPVDIDSPFVITGLDNGTTYAVRVRALNDAGEGAQSNSVNGTPRTVPDAPADLVATPGGTSASIAFTDPDDGGDAITDIQYRVDGGAWTSTDPETLLSPIVIPDLTADTEYSVDLRAVNGAGNSAVSDPVVFTTDSVPDAPTDLVATVGNETVSIAFTPGANNGAAITNYKYTMNDGVVWTAFDPADATSPVVIAPLPNDIEYTVKLRAVNAMGDGAISEAVVFTPVDQVPAAPTNLIATPGVLSASIAFTAPDNGGSAITDYEYTMNGGVAWSSGATAVSPLVLDPIPAVETTVSIRAVNAVGNGPASASVTFTPAAE